MESHETTTYPQDSIAILWHIDDVRNVRPDLDDTQCREVLRYCEDRHDAEIGINWDVIRTVAEECFPETGEAGQ
jgi:hypothetical protein